MLSDEIADILKPRSTPLAGSRALITGASSGIGLAMAVRLAVEGCHLTLVARPSERLEALKEKLTDLNPASHIHTLSLDLKSPDAIETLQAEKAFDAQILVNNAGLALGLSSIINSRVSDWSEMLNTNITAAFQISKEAAKHMSQNGGGDIVALSSIAAHHSYENGAVYCASKHAVRAFHEALRLETLDQNIRVLMISPGMVQTEFSLVRFNGDQEKAERVYSGVRALNAGDVADCIMFALKQPRHINIDDLILKPRQQGNPWRVQRDPL